MPDVAEDMTSSEFRDQNYTTTRPKRISCNNLLDERVSLLSKQIRYNLLWSFLVSQAFSAQCLPVALNRRTIAL